MLMHIPNDCKIPVRELHELFRRHGYVVVQRWEGGKVVFRVKPMVESKKEPSNVD